MSNHQKTPPNGNISNDLLTAGLLEAICVITGGLVFALTGHWMWLAIGILAGLGFSLPAIIRLIRARKEQDDAS